MSLEDKEKKRYRILLVEDDKVSAIVIQKYLDIKGFDVIYCSNGDQGLQEFSKRNGRVDLCILDVMMLGVDGFTLAAEIRAMDELVPILFVTSKSLAEDKIKAFKLGADDYITKPFNSEELFLRINAILKRQNSQPREYSRDEISLPSVVNIGKYSLNIPFRRLKIGDDERKLTARETELLCFLIKSKNQLIKRELILQEIWGDDDYYKGRSLDVFMSRLRKYLKGDPNIEIINVHTHGFKFVVQGEEEGVEF